jgi:hypothetical protein
LKNQKSIRGKNFGASLTEGSQNRLFWAFLGSAGSENGQIQKMLVASFSNFYWVSLDRKLKKMLP